MEYVILVDEQDRELGTLEKMEAHQRGVLHRAFSVLIFNNRGELLLQKRAASKYHSRNLWTNTCCSHPRLGESLQTAAQRRLMEEMGIACAVEPLYSFVYQVSLDNGLIEHELDHVLVGYCDEAPVINPQEVAEWKYVSLDWVREDAMQNPEQYTYWFRLILTHPELMQVVIP